MKTITSRISKNPISDHIHHQRNRSYDKNRKCSCCQNQKRYHDYLPQLRQQRLEKQKKKQLAERILDMPNIHDIPNENKQQISPVNEDQFINNISNRLSEYMDTPRKPSLLQSFHESIIRSSIKSKGQLFNSKRVEHKSPLNEQELFSSKKKSKGFKFEVCIEVDGQIHSREFSSIKYGVKAIQEIENVLASKI